jgi:hypothetical protein
MCPLIIQSSARKKDYITIMNYASLTLSDYSTLFVELWN